MALALVERLIRLAGGNRHLLMHGRLLVHGAHGQATGADTSSGMVPLLKCRV